MLEMGTVLLNKSAVSHKKKKKRLFSENFYTYFLQAISSMKNNRRQQNVEKNFWVKCYLKNKILNFN